MNKTELKYSVQATGSNFFDRQTMRFFGDTMANYYVPKEPVLITNTLGEKITCYMLRRVHPVKHGLQSPAFFNIVTFERVHPKRD